MTNEQLTKTASLQVKFSKDFLGNKGGKNALIETKIKAGGWWKFKHDKIENSPADLWILVLYRFSHRDFDFVIIELGQLLEIYNKLDRASDNIQSYLWVTESGKCWETRGL